MITYVTILILIDGFLQYDIKTDLSVKKCVTILILIDGFLQSRKQKRHCLHRQCHNPYFNRWFSAITTDT